MKRLFFANALNMLYLFLNFSGMGKYTFAHTNINVLARAYVQWTFGKWSGYQVKTGKSMSNTSTST